VIRSLVLENYRGFRHFEMRNLGRVNLIVGTNNAGKTSVLEAIHIVERPTDVRPIWSTLTRRGEDTEEREGGSVVRRHVEVRRLFHGHEITLGNDLIIRAQTDRGTDSFRAFFSQSKPNNEQAQPNLFDTFESVIDLPGESRDLSLGLQWNHAPSGADNSALFKLSSRGSLVSDVLRSMNSLLDESHPPVRFVANASLSPEVIIDLFEEIVLTPSEEFVVDALRIIEPTIERLATGGTERRRLSTNRVGVRGGLLVRCQGVKERIPIGSMGDGIWRMLGLALALARTKGGILLIDEIDTGLHYSVMENMWELVSKTANRLGIQVFATTHSRDCYESLASISRNIALHENEISMQRIERGKESAVAYSEREIIAAAKRHLEVR
jgi:predicted ATPase